MSVDRDRSRLHPLMRDRGARLDAAIARAGLPFAVYEAWRDPVRQAFLFAQGRVDGHGTPGHHVTFERAWGSRHQFGLAEDYAVLAEDGAWTWPRADDPLWVQLSKLARSCDLETLDFERPHVQVPGLAPTDLAAGVFPAGGDETWAESLYAAIASWGSAPRTLYGIVHPPAPPWRAAMPLTCERPPLALAA